MSRSFTFNWKVTLFSITCLVVFVSLGFWQLDREDQKRRLMALQEALEVSEPLPLDVLSDEPLHGQPVWLTGSFDELAIWLHDNKVLDGQVGFEVNQLFNDDTGISVIINRGFVPMGRTRDDIPDIPVVEAPTEILARVYVPDGEPLVLGEEMQGEDADLTSYPAVLQQIDPLVIADTLPDITLFPWVLRLPEGESGALPRHWPVTVMLPEQHRGYAIQWFAMALAVAAAWTFFSFRSVEE